METLIQVLILIFMNIVLFIISVAILRWAFRVNDIVSRLEHISTSNYRMAQTLDVMKASLDRKKDSSISRGDDDSSNDDE